MPKARTTNPPPPDLALLPEEEHVDPALGFLQVNEEQECAVSEAIEASVAGVLEFIRGRQLEDIIHDHTAAIVTADIARIYATVDIRYDPGHDQSLPPPTDGDPSLQDEDTAASTTSVSQQNAIVERNGSTIEHGYEHQKVGTLWPSPEPQPAPIDRWARGWVVAKSGNARQWNRSRNGGMSEAGSDGGRSIRSARSMGTSLSSAHRHGGHARHRQHNSSNKEDRLGVPFPIAPEPREDQSLPPPVPRKDRGGGVGRRKGGGGGRRGRRYGKGGGGGGGGSIGSGDGLENDRSLEGSAVDGEEEDDDIGTRVKDLGGREWTLDAFGELLVVERPQGDAMPKTIVSTLYNFRDVQQRGGGGDEGIPEGGGGGAGGEGRGKRRGGGGGKRKSISSSSSASAFGKGRKQSSSALRRASRRRSSRRLSGRRRITGVFFELEPTLQPNLTNSLDRPGAGVTVSDGSSLKEGPTWPQDPNHMSRSEYQQRQRQQDLCDANTLDGGGDASTIGFSLGSVQSAPALGGLGLGLGGRSGGGAGDDSGRQSLSGSGGGRGTSITAFEDVNPFAGGVRATTSAPTWRGGVDRGAASSPAGGDLSPLSASIGGQSGTFFSGAGPESSSLGEDSDDPHLALVNDPEWGRNVRGSPKESGFLPKVKQVSRERPLTHERPHTRNPRDPRNVPARQHAHVSPKTKHHDHHQRGADKSKGGGSDGLSQRTGVGGASFGSSSFPSLSMPPAGWGAGEGGAPSFGVGGGSWGAARSGRGEGMISMAKPKDILVQGLLR